MEGGRKKGRERGILENRKTFTSMTDTQEMSSGIRGVEKGGGEVK